MSTVTSYRLAIAAAVTTALFLVLGIGALGIIGDGGRPDRGYLAVLLVLAIGTVIARLRAREMAVTLLATALTQVVVTTVALLAGLHLAEDASVVDMIGITGMYAVLFGLSAWLFWRAAGQPAEVAVATRV